MLKYEFTYTNFNANLDEKFKFSIVTPLYKANLKFLKEAAHSVFKQSYSNWEWIIVDDGSSTSDSTKYAYELAKQHNRVKVFEC